VAALLCVGGIWFWASNGLADSSDSAFERMIKAPPDPQPQIARVAPVVAPPPPPPPPPEAPPEPSTLDRLRTFLKPEIDQGLVAVVGDERRPVVRIKGTGMFGSGSADVSPRFVPLLERIGAALAEEEGKVTVQGHSDNVPIRTVRFPSNFQLSAARAESAMKIILNTLRAPDRIRFEGKADAEPIASNATPDGREANRRIEVVLQRP
jgi:type VI secretion system protein ImpK